MKTCVWLLLIPVTAPAQDDEAARGAAVYRVSCAVAYCHGPEGKPGRAPGLAARGLDGATIAATVMQGVPNTSMPSFAGQLKPGDIEAVAAYIVSLGGSGREVKDIAKQEVPMPAGVRRGRELFFDAARTGNCGSCHEAGGWGVLVSTALQDLAKAHLNNLRSIETPDVVTARPAGEDAFPAVVAEKTPARVRVYDLSARLPVLRTFAPADVALTSGSSWHHSDAAAIYSGAELEAIAGYLRWAAAH